MAAHSKPHSPSPSPTREDESSSENEFKPDAEEDEDEFNPDVNDDDEEAHPPPSDDDEAAPKKRQKKPTKPKPKARTSPKPKAAATGKSKTYTADQYEALLLVATKDAKMHMFADAIPGRTAKQAYETWTRTLRPWLLAKAREKAG